MLAELVRTETTDGVRLDGALHDVSDSPWRRRALILLSGVGGNFYGSSLVDALASILVEHGWTTLRANTRAHDLVNWAQVSGRVRWEGASFETVSKCRLDLPAWITFLQRRGYDEVILVGHSLGAIKSLYAAAHGSEPLPSSIVAISPPRLSYAAFMNGPQQPAFLESIQAAQHEMRQARHTALLTVKFPFPLLISAAAYVDKYGPDENYNILKFADRIPCPVLFVYGELELAEGGVAFAGLPEALAALDHQGPAPEFQVVAGADHMFTDRYEQLGQQILPWLRR